MSDPDNYIDLTGVPKDARWCPEMKYHTPMVEDNGIVIFSLGEYSMTQLAIEDNGQIKLDWFYVDVGTDGHAIRGFDLAKKVLLQTMKMHQKANLLRVERLGEKS